MSRILYKYLDITGGKMMLGNSDLQYTNASQLNDPFDCHPKLLDYSNVPDTIAKDDVHKEWEREVAENDALNLRNDTWLTSFSKVNDSILMWAHYCNNHSGICVGLDMDKVPPIRGMLFLKPFEIEVEYTDILKKPDRYREADWQYQWRTKAKEWGYEHEVRLVIPRPAPEYAAFTPKQADENKKNKHKVWDWKEIHHYVDLPADCFESVYFGINIDQKEKEKIYKYMQERFPETKLYQMTIDPDALRLKAERI
ncbi:MAG: DUF2971 domain-containing protein [Paludibacteraceae bacterium]|nr:DUF2971 domain-containing protein [Paludibacteraceae bacterium]MBO4690041.1 DUF2971 domain-containing protein [Paludibacteraceae bacterium]